MFGVNGVDSWNFFGKDKSNHIEAARGISFKSVSAKFSEATRHVQTLGLKELATHYQDGEEVRNPKYPWKVILRASSSVENLFSDNYVEDYTR